MYLKGIMPPLILVDYFKPDSCKNDNQNIYDGYGLIANEFKQLAKDATICIHIPDEDLQTALYQEDINKKKTDNIGESRMFINKVDYSFVIK